MVLPTSIPLPLYLYPPSPNGTPTWTFLFNTLLKYPNLTFNIIIEDSGPTPIDLNGCPVDTNYLAAIANLTTFENTRLLGYSHLEYTARNISDVENDIAICTSLLSYLLSKI